MVLYSFRIVCRSPLCNSFWIIWQYPFRSKNLRQSRCLYGRCFWRNIRNSGLVCNSSSKTKIHDNLSSFLLTASIYYDSSGFIYNMGCNNCRQFPDRKCCSSWRLSGRNCLWLVSQNKIQEKSKAPPKNVQITVK